MQESRLPDRGHRKVAPRARRKGVKSDWNGDVKPGPLEIGLDYSFLLPSTNDRVPSVYLDNHKVINLDPADPLFVGVPKRPQPATPCDEPQPSSILTCCNRRLCDPW